MCRGEEPLSCSELLGWRGRADRGGGREVILVSLSVSLAATPSPSGLTHEITIVRGQGIQRAYVEDRSIYVLV